MRNSDSCLLVISVLTTRNVDGFQTYLSRRQGRFNQTNDEGEGFNVKRYKEVETLTRVTRKTNYIVGRREWTTLRRTRSSRERDIPEGVGDWIT